MYTITNLVLFNLSILVLVFLLYKIRKYDYFKIIFLSIIISFYFGVRPLNVGADTLAYYSVFINNSGYHGSNDSATIEV
jgi:hypothetical protein